MAHITISAPQTSTFGRSVFSVVAQLRAWNAARKTRAALSKLSPHVLDDIGLMPGDIDRLR
ncbi:MAG: DUF1127 domain-containing protein [Pseudomonadota bacterium]